MKKNLVSIVSLVFLVGLVSLTSCKKEETLCNGTQFRATMEGYTSQNGKTTLNGTALEWVAGDQIVVYGITGSGIYTATPQTPATTAVFDNVSGETGNAPFRAFYPSTLTTDGVNITLPATQTTVDGSLTNFPMYAESNNDELSFKNLCGVLKLHLTKVNTNISSIEVVANSVVNGTFSVSLSGGVPELSYVSGGTNSVTLTCTTAQDISNGADFYVCLPTTFDSVKSIKLVTDGGMICIKKVKITSQINVSRSQYTLVTLGENDMEFYDPTYWVDLGLPSGLLWATRNVGATSPEGYGNYYAWGETTPKRVYSWSNYSHCNGSEYSLTKYCYDSYFSNNGFTDNLTILQTVDDAASVNYGGRTPTKEEWEELIANTTVQYTTLNGVNGRRYTGTNGNSLFLPAAGFRWDSSLGLAGYYGGYWSSSLYVMDDPLYTGGPIRAWEFDFYSDDSGQAMGAAYRYFGQSVRAVRSAQ